MARRGQRCEVRVDDDASLRRIRSIMKRAARFALVLALTVLGAMSLLTTTPTASSYGKSPHDRIFAYDDLHCTALRGQFSIASECDAIPAAPVAVGAAAAAYGRAEHSG